MQHTIHDNTIINGLIIRMRTPDITYKGRFTLQNFVVNEQLKN